jgi:hypothetical protein
MRVGLDSAPHESANRSGRVPRTDTTKRPSRAERNVPQPKTSRAVGEFHRVCHSRRSAFPAYPLPAGQFRIPRAAVPRICPGRWTALKESEHRASPRLVGGTLWQPCPRRDHAGSHRGGSRRSGNAAFCARQSPQGRGGARDIAACLQTFRRYGESLPPRRSRMSSPRP